MALSANFAYVQIDKLMNIWLIVCDRKINTKKNHALETDIWTDEQMDRQ